ncbi:hypothetical protein [Methylobacterium mesophilicum]
MLRHYKIVGCHPPGHPPFIAIDDAKRLKAATEDLIEKFYLDAEEAVALSDHRQMRTGPA